VALVLFQRRALEQRPLTAATAREPDAV